MRELDEWPIQWEDHEDRAIKLYERFGDEFGESQIYRIRFTELIEWVLEIKEFEGVREDCTEGHLEQIQAKWVYEWRDNQWIISNQTPPLFFTWFDGRIFL